MNDVQITLDVSQEMDKVLEYLAKKNSWSKADVLYYGVSFVAAATKAWEEGNRVAIIPQHLVGKEITELLIAESIDG